MSNRCRAFLLAVFSLVLTLISSPHFAVAQAPQNGGEACAKCQKPDHYKKFSGGFKICADSDASNNGVAPCQRDKPDQPKPLELDMGTPSELDSAGHGATKTELEANGNEINNLITTIKDRKAKQQDKDDAKAKLKDKLNDPSGPYRDVCRTAIQRFNPCYPGSKSCSVGTRSGKCGNIHSAAGDVHDETSKVESLELSSDNKVVVNCTFPADYCRCYLADLMADVEVAYETLERELSEVFFGH